MTARPSVGVLALQGDVREHLRALEAAGARPVPVRRPRELTGLAGIVLPGGESTTIGKLLQRWELLEPLQAALRDGLPAYGTCAGMILLSERVLDGMPDQPLVGGLDITVRRNAFGRQVDSFEGDVHWAGFEAAFHAVFIRAPWVESAGPSVEVLARVADDAPVGAAGRVVAVRQGNLLATAFHPELAGDTRVHELFVAGLSDRPGR